MPGAADFFYYIEQGGWPWIAALDAEGRGLAQASTARLKGRKLFVWGMGAGGRRWQRFLAAGGPPYIEIQAGLARTQGECLPMPPGARWEWLEAYGLLEADPGAVQGDDWAAARAEAEARFRRIVTPEWMEAELLRGAATADRAPEEVVLRGSGWGALERRRRTRSGEPPFCSRSLVFDDASLGEAQAPWLALLEHGAMPDGDAPAAWMVQPEWRAMLEDAVSHGRGAHGRSWLHLGVMRQQNREFEAARAAYERSLALAPSAWAYRNPALMAAAEKQPAQAADLYRKAVALAPQMVPLLVEAGQSLIAAGCAAEVIALLERLPAPVGRHARLRVLRAQAALAAGDLQAVEQIVLSGIEVSDLREGEQVLTDLWFAVQERRVAAAEGVPVDDALRQRVRRELVPPAEIDCRMAAT
jgi:tetratricopeptide (TPR) repeat protein